MTCHYCGGSGGTLREHYSWCAVAMAEKEAQRLKVASLEASDEGESISRQEPSELQDKSHHPLPARPVDTTLRTAELQDLIERMFPGSRVIVIVTP